MARKTTIDVSAHARQLSAFNTLASPEMEPNTPVAAYLQNPQQLLQPYPAFVPQNLNGLNGYPHPQVPVATQDTYNLTTTPVDTQIPEKSPITLYPKRSSHRQRGAKTSREGTRATEVIKYNYGRAMRYLGLSALALCVGAAGVVAKSAGESFLNADQGRIIEVAAAGPAPVFGAAEQQDNDASKEEAQDTVEEAEAPSSSSTTSTAPKLPPRSPFDPRFGQTVGEIRIPAICIDDMQVDAYSEAENQPLWDGGLVGGGQAVIDRLIPDERDQITDCYATDQIGMMAREQLEEVELGTNYEGRGERKRSNLISPENPEGKVSYFKPIAGFPHREDGELITQEPCTLESTTIFSHGSTYSAGGGDTSLLRPGDTMYVTLNDADANYSATTCEYEFVDNTPVKPDDEATLYGPEKGVLKWVRCGDENGLTGDPATRYMSRFILKEINGVSADQYYAQITPQQ